MKLLQEKSKERLIALKIYFDRARMYLGYINFFILNLVLINSFENPAVKLFIQDYKYFVVPALFVIYMILLIFIGFLDTKLGFRQEEMRNNALVNPVMMDLIQSVNEIKTEVKKNSKEGLSSSSQHSKGMINN